MPAPKFPITLRFRGGLSPSQQAIFTAAAERWQRVIVKPLTRTRLPDGTITAGIVISAQGVSIDGPSGILGQAGPTLLRPPTDGAAAFLPCQGVMSFDSADLLKMEQSGTLLDVISHEIAHVLGIGTVWSRKARLLGAGSGNPVFTGPRATGEFSTLAHTHAI